MPSIRRKPSHTVAPPAVSSQLGAWALNGGQLERERRRAGARGERVEIRGRDGEQLKRLNVRVPVDLHRELRAHCAANDLFLDATVAAALRQFLK